MKIIVDIPDKVYDYFARGLRYEDDVEAAIIAIVDGISLPKGHGNLIYREDVETMLRVARIGIYEDIRKKSISDSQTGEVMLLNEDQMMLLSGDHFALFNVEQLVHSIEPIIEAEQEEKMKKIRAIIKRPDEKDGHVTSISAKLENLQTIVGGYLEIVTLGDAVMLIDEEGKSKGLEPNFKTPYDMIVGTVIVLGVDGEDFGDCPLDFKVWKKLLRDWGN